MKGPTVLAAFLAAVLAAPVVAAVYQSPPNSIEQWVLAGDAVSPEDPLTMWRVIPDTEAPVGGVVVLAPGETAVWTSNESALANFELGGAKTFTVRLQVRAGTLLEIAVGTYDASFTACGTPRQIDVGAVGSLPPVDPVDETRAEVYTITFQPETCPILAGEHIAMTVKALNTPARIGTEDAERITGADIPRSTLSYAFTPPAWPTPELPTIALSAIGGVLALAWVARRRSS